MAPEKIVEPHTIVFLRTPTGSLIPKIIYTVLQDLRLIVIDLSLVKQLFKWYFLILTTYHWYSSYTPMGYLILIISIVLRDLRLIRSDLILIKKLF